MPKIENEEKSTNKIVVESIGLHGRRSKLFFVGEHKPRHTCLPQDTDTSYMKKRLLCKLLVL